MTKIFISYRRKDDPYAARGINDALCKKFGKRNVYFDLEAIQAGLDFRKQIDDMVAKCDAMLVVIGAKWLKDDEPDRSHLEVVNDLVVLEVSSALKRDIPVIPVLVGNAAIPSKDNIPDSIKSLVYRQAVEVRATANFNAQIENLVKNIEAVAPSGRPSLLTWTYAIASIAVVVAISWLGWQLAFKPEPMQEEPATLSQRQFLMPNVIGLTVAEAESRVYSAGRSIRATSAKAQIVERRSDARPAGQIIRQMELPGKLMRPDMDGKYGEVTFSVVVSTGTQQKVIQKYALTINPEPADAKIRFLSTGQEYQPGVMVKPGRYHVEVSRPGYITQTRWLEIESHDLNLNSVLEEKQPMFVDGQVFKDCDECPEMVVIPAGRFFMGSSGSSSSTKEKPRHQVTIPKFAMGKYEVTFDQYGGFARSTGRDLPKDGGWERSGRPVINVSWDHAQAFIKWLSEETGRRYRLPSEAEWEYAARAGARIDVPYWWGSDIEHNRANCIGCGSEWDSGLTAPTGSFDSNPFGLNDMNGNVQEWVEDCSHANYEKAPHDGSAWLKTVDGDCAVRMVRGGSWRHKPEGLRSAARVKYSRSQTSPSIGFRIARDLSD